MFRVQRLPNKRYVENEFELYLVYFVSADAETIKQIEQEFEDGSLPALVENNRGQWLNRDPYALYKAVMKKKSIWDRNPEMRWTADEKDLKDISKHHSYIPPLEVVEGMTPDEMTLFHRRYLLCNWLSAFISDTEEKEMFSRRRSYDNDQIYIGAPSYSVSHSMLHEASLPSRDLPEHVVWLKITPALDSRPAVMRQFLDSLREIPRPILFEIVSHQGSIYFQLMCAAQDHNFIERQLQLYFPSFTIAELPNAVTTAPLYSFDAYPYSSTESFKTSTDFTIDPNQQLFTILADTAPHDYTSVQFCFAPLDKKTIRMFIDFAKAESVSDRALKPLEKIQPAWLAGLRVFASQPATLEAIKTTFLKQFEALQKQWTILETKRLPSKDQRTSPWGIVNTAELVTFAHFPDKTVQCDLLETAQMKAKLPPDLYTKKGVVIGTSTARGQTKTVTIPDSVRDRHAYVVGKSGTGKSTLLFNCIRQDIERGNGVAVIDPHGDLVEEVLRYIPQERIEDTIYFNTADKEHPIGLNILNAQDEDEIGLLADDLLITFKRLSESWGERMENILRYSFHSLLRAEGATFLDLKTLLQNPDYRQQVAASSNNRMLRDFWALEYPNYPKDAAQPILNRMSKFSLSPTLTGILGQPDSSLNFFDVIQNKKILLVNISKGQIGEDTAQLLGSLIVSQLQLAIMRRAAMPKEARDPYYLYVDEFQNFTTSAFEKILSEARKYKLCLTLAHQYISQLDERTKNAILANIGTIVMFQSYPADAQALRPELGQYEPTDVTNLNTASHEALCKPSTQSKDTFMLQTLARPPKPESHAKQIIEYTRENYATTPISYDAPAVGHSPAPQAVAPAIHYPTRPARALPKEFANQGDRILHYVSQAEWLATPQIHQLCYSHVKEESRKSNASRDLKALLETKRVKFQNFGKEKIYYTGRQPNPTTHNYSIRDLFAKILASDYELAEVNFFPQLPGLTPDLAVSFLNDDGSQTKTFWEYDAGTEGIAELLKKVSRYDLLAKDSLVVFVFNTKERCGSLSRQQELHA